MHVSVQVRKHVMEEVNKAGKAKKLRGFEMIKSVLLDEEAWSGGHSFHLIMSMSCEPWVTNLRLCPATAWHMPDANDGYCA